MRDFNAITIYVYTNGYSAQDPYVSHFYCVHDEALQFATHTELKKKIIIMREPLEKTIFKYAAAAKQLND